MSSRKKKRIVIKLGTGILTKPKTGMLDRGQIRRLSNEVADAMEQGHECILVSSGAVGAGLAALGYKQRPSELSEKQACASVGQLLLMREYESAFRSRGFGIAQLLLTHPDIDSRRRRLNTQRTLFYLLQRGGIVPVINENDVVAVEELRFGDNDELSAEVAHLAEAELLIILTSVRGLMRMKGTEAEVVSEVRDVQSAMHYASQDVGPLSTGGMISKLRAAELALAFGISTVIASGRQEGLIGRILAGERVGTRFVVPKRG